MLFRSFSKACLSLRAFAPLLAGGRAARGRANNGGCGVKNARSAFFTPHPPLGERRRREQAIMMGIRHTLKRLARTLLDFYRGAAERASWTLLLLGSGTDYKGINFRNLPAPVGYFHLMPTAHQGYISHVNQTKDDW